MNSIVRDIALSPEFAADDFRHAMRTLVGGVSIITAGYGGDISGMTVTSLTSLSAEPPRVMVGVNRSASVFPLIERFGSFGINILAAHHEDIAVRFSTKAIIGAARFAGLHCTTLVSGTPLLSDAATALDCQVEEVIERHSHAIVIGRVLGARGNDDRGALAYRLGKFVRMESHDTPEDDLAKWAVW